MHSCPYAHFSPQVRSRSYRSSLSGRLPFWASPLLSRLANASGRIEFIILLIMDWSFASGCSPPRLSATQFPSARCCCEMSASASRRDNTDRSLARSAWESVPRKNRPVGYGMTGAANPRGISRPHVRPASYFGDRTLELDSIHLPRLSVILD